MGSKAKNGVMKPAAIDNARSHRLGARLCRLRFSGDRNAALDLKAAIGTVGPAVTSFRMRRSTTTKVDQSYAYVRGSRRGAGRSTSCRSSEHHGQCEAGSRPDKMHGFCSCRIAEATTRPTNDGAGCYTKLPAPEFCHRMICIDQAGQFVDILGRSSSRLRSCPRNARAQASRPLTS